MEKYGVEAEIAVTFVLDKAMDLTFHCNSEVNDGDLDTHLRQVMRIGHFGGHVQLECSIIIDITISQTNQVSTALLENSFL